MESKANKLLTILLIVLIAVQIGLMIGRPSTPAAADDTSAIVREMDEQTRVFENMNRNLEKVVYYMDRAGKN